MERIPPINPETPKEKDISVDDILNEIEACSEPLDDFSIQNLNPFDNIEELQNFSNSVNQGAGVSIIFEEPWGIGEEIQGKYISQFFSKFFPNAEVGVDTKKTKGRSPSRVIRVDMLDFGEKRNIDAKNKVKFKNPREKYKGVFFSMVQTKLIHNIKVPLVMVDQLKKGIFDEIQKKRLAMAAGCSYNCRYDQP